MDVLLTIPSFHGKGGVSNYYRTILPFLNNSIDYKISHIEIGGLNRSNKLFHVLRDQLRVHKHISYNMVDLIHVNPSLDPKSLLRDGIFTLLAKRKGVPVLVFFHGWKIPLKPLYEGILRSLAKISILKADFFIVLSSSFRDKLKKWGVNAPVFVESTIVDDNLLLDFSIEEKINSFIDKKKTRILFLARIEKDKGIFETIDALKILLKRRHDVCLSIAGVGSALEQVKRYIENNKEFSHKVNLLGYVRGIKKMEVFNSEHIYCFPTTHGEGMPTSVLEAMAFGMPIITRPVGGLKDFFENGKMGYFTKEREPEAIADLLEKLIINKTKMIDIANYNHVYAKEHFLASKAAIRLKKIYRKTMSGK